MRSLDPIERRFAFRAASGAIAAVAAASLTPYLDGGNALESPGGLIGWGVLGCVIGLMPAGMAGASVIDEYLDWLIYTLGVVGLLSIPVLWNAV